MAHMSHRTPSDPASQPEHNRTMLERVRQNVRRLVNQATPRHIRANPFGKALDKPDDIVDELTRNAIRLNPLIKRHVIDGFEGVPGGFRLGWAQLPQTHGHAFSIGLFTDSDHFAQIALADGNARVFAGTDPDNLNDKGIQLIGRPLYEAFIKNYTGKQWQTDPSELPAAIIKRLPVRFNYDNRYFKDTWEGLPKDGYTKWMERMIDDPRITVELGVDFFDESQPYNKTALKAAGVPVVYTGPVDRYFDYELGDLKWRTVDFKEVRYDEGDHFGCPVMNFSDADVPYTRAIEFKNFNPERHDSQNPNKTVVWEEYRRFAARGDEPYYPVTTDADKALYAQYEAKAKAEPNTVFGGRLGTYKYYDMHNVIDTALTAYEEQVAPLLKK